MTICERELRKAVSAVPDGIYGPEDDWIDDDGIDLGKSYRISATLEVKGDELHFALDSDPQARGPVNLQPCVSRNFIQSCVKSIFIPNLPVNEGLSAPITVTYPPEGSLLHPRYPAPCNMYVRASQMTAGVVLRCLARAVPGKVPAPASGAGGSLSSAGRNPQTGKWYSQYEIFTGGCGARPFEDGPSAMDDLVNNVMNGPVEALETEFPMRIEAYELVADSGGAGKYRGGLGTRRRWRILSEESTVNLRSDRFKHAAPGLFGAKPAKPSRALLNPGTENERVLTSKIAGLRLKKDDIVVWELAGGGGYGEPMLRDPERVRLDVLRGYVSREAARKDYGVVLRDDNSLDADATAKLRAMQ